MKKPIRLNAETRAALLQQCQEEIEKMGNSLDGKFTVSKAFEYGNDVPNANLLFSPMAYFKMQELIKEFASEVAWHGTITRSEDEETGQLTYVVTDILVYPQMVSGATVNTDQKKYEDWLYALEDDVFNNVRFQGHSHVTMGVTPSIVDTTHQTEILSALPDDTFYVFVIWNKQNKFWVKIFDSISNTMYETDDVNIGVLGGTEGLSGFIKAANEVVTTAASVAAGTTYRDPYNWRDRDVPPYYGTSAPIKQITTIASQPAAGGAQSSARVGEKWLNPANGSGGAVAEKPKAKETVGVRVDDFGDLNSAPDNPYYFAYGSER